MADGWWGLGAQFLAPLRGAARPAFEDEAGDRTPTHPAYPGHAFNPPDA
ncbi:hypothetical protein ABZ656_15010 [Streptomyces sp. NPDC007095]